MAKDTGAAKTVEVAYIGCWYKYDMYSHSCSNLIGALRAAGVQVSVVTSNCRCFSSATKFAIAADELVNIECSPIAIPHAPRNPGKKHGRLKYLAVKTFRLDLLLAASRGFLYYREARKADIIHFDQVLEAFGCLPLFILLMLASVSGKRVFVTVHEIDPFEREHPWLNRLYNRCTKVFVYSEDMKRQVVRLGVDPERVQVIRYGAEVSQLIETDRKQYIYFGGHHILKGKGYLELLHALARVQEAGRPIRLLIYVGHGCNGLDEAKELAARYGVAQMIEWREFASRDGLEEVYQQSKACIIPYTGGSARHPLTCAMANATPIIATRAIDIPEYLGELGIYIDGSAASIAAAILEIEGGAVKLDRLGAGLRAKAHVELGYDRIAAVIASEYSRAGFKLPGLHDDGENLYRQHKG
jgi:glycosyltransferase involved in cell wall biosynthesis